MTAHTTASTRGKIPLVVLMKSSPAAVRRRHQQQMSKPPSQRPLSERPFIKDGTPTKDDIIYAINLISKLARDRKAEAVRAKKGGRILADTS